MSVNYLLALGVVLLFSLCTVNFLLGRELAMSIYGALSIFCLVIVLLVPKSITISARVWIVFIILVLVALVIAGSIIFKLSKKGFVDCLIVLFLALLECYAAIV